MSTVVIKKSRLQRIVKKLDYVHGVLNHIYFESGLDQRDDGSQGYIKAEIFLLDSTKKLKNLLNRTVD